MFSGTSPSTLHTRQVTEAMMSFLDKFKTPTLQSLSKTCG